MAAKLDPAARKNALKKLVHWNEVIGRDAIERTFVFGDFQQAFAFMTRVAEKAEAMNHHPEWTNIYKTVEVTLTTHDCKGVSALDVELASFMDETARQ
ncbi:MAG: 4a-hydroxytetrahydrobiopterin dehydratase [Rhodospirillaceae bacterium]|nr:4a-hydroxytetrahydrobiopterin dehydratase [Rhodospirillaceae bacterium]